MEATESDALDVIDILRYAMIDTIEDDRDVMPKLHSHGKLTNRKVNCAYVRVCTCFYIYSKLYLYERFKCL